MAIYTMVKNNTFNGMPLPVIIASDKDGSWQIVRQFGYEDFKMRRFLCPYYWKCCAAESCTPR